MLLGLALFFSISLLFVDVASAFELITLGGTPATVSVIKEGATGNSAYGRTGLA